MMTFKVTVVCVSSSLLLADADTAIVGRFPVHHHHFI
jgi:hypothetical protein